MPSQRKACIERVKQSLGLGFPALVAIGRISARAG